MDWNYLLTIEWHQIPNHLRESTQNDKAWPWLTIIVHTSVDPLEEKDDIIQSYNFIVWYWNAQQQQVIWTWVSHSQAGPHWE